VNNLYVVAVTKYVLLSFAALQVNDESVAITRSNANAALVFEFCYRFINIAKSYFRKVDEESVKNNFTLIYELIDGT
jgi:AP-2 complex subunit mu-1